MEPLDDRELNRMLKEWKAPDAPPTLRLPALPRSQPWWRWLVTGTIRVPVPVGMAIAALLVGWIYWSWPVSPPASSVPPPSVTLADFQPVDRLEVRVVGVVK